MDVKIRCLCPPVDGAARHEQDTVTLPEVIDFRTMLTIRSAIRLETQFARERGDVLTIAEMTAVMAEAYLLHCITAWSLQDETGKPLPVSRSNVTSVLIADWESAEAVGDAADSLYSDKVVLPLLNRASSSLPPTPTPAPTSATNGHGSTPRKPSKRSSTSTTPMVVTGPMAASPGGVSNSLPS